MIVPQRFQPKLPPKSGQDIREALARGAPSKVPIVDELLYRKKVTLLAADPSTGKSTLALQIAMAATSGTPAFGVLDVPNPVPVYVIPFETDWDEFIAALHRASEHTPINMDMIHFDDELLGLDVGSPFGADHIIERIKAYSPGLIIVDPLYLLVAGDLADGGIAAKAMKWLLRLAQQCNAAVLVLHHTHRERYGANGKEIKEKDSSYGSRWIKANVVVQYNIKAESGGTKWTLTKDRYKFSRSELVLHYDPETGLSTALKSKRLVKDELYEHIRWHKVGATFTYPSLAELFDCAEGYLAHLMVQPQFRKLVRKDAPPGKPVTLVRIFDNDIDGNGMAKKTNGQTTEKEAA